MCGISGFIGNSKNPELSYLLASNLFGKLEIRGKHASGFWASNKLNEIIFHKKPVKSSLFVKNNLWEKVKDFNPNILLCHAREASSGVGIPSINKNNHPFVNYDKTIALIHNGRIPDDEYNLFLNYYEVASKCDSEILLRVFENYNGFDGIKKIWSYFKSAQMAVAIGENSINKQKLYLFRNIHRPICIVDAQDILGQIFFCSTPEIWTAAKNNKIKNLLKKRIKIINLPPEELWYFELEQQLNIQRYGIEINDIVNALNHPKVLLKAPQISSRTFCSLDEHDEPIMHKNQKEKVCNELLIIIKKIEKLLISD